MVNADGDKERLPPSQAGSSSLVDHSGTHRHAEHSGTESSEFGDSPSIEEKKDKHWLPVVKAHKLHLDTPKKSSIEKGALIIISYESGNRQLFPTRHFQVVLLLALRSQRQR